MSPYTHTCTHHTCSSSVLLCGVLFTSCLLVECLSPMPCISLQLILIVHHMHHSACFTCYIYPHIPCYMSALFSTCYLSVSTIQHIHQAYMYLLHTCYLLFVIYQGAPWYKRFACTQRSVLRTTSTIFNSYN